MVKKTLISLALCASAMCMAQQINPITKAVLDGYSEILKQNPKDYATLYDRASQLYQMSQYDQALDDITKAVEYTPAKEKELKKSELSLMADIALQQKNYRLALKAVTDALELDPKDYALVYKKGNIALHLNEPELAYRTFSSMQSLKSRSQEAYFGMAKACIMQNKYQEAEELLKEAENADPSNYLTYCRVGDLYQDMKMPEKAATNYIVGFSVADGDIRPLLSLATLANTNYNAVSQAMEYAIDKTTKKLPLLYVLGNLSVETGHYSEADAAYSRLLEYPDGQMHTVYGQQAIVKLGLNQLEEAAAFVEKALSDTSLTNTYRGIYLTLLSQINLAAGDAVSALQNANQSLLMDSEVPSAILAKAYALIALDNADGALAVLNHLIMESPDNTEALLARAYVQDNMKHDGKAAIADYNRIILQDTDDFKGIAINAIARAKNGKKLDADAMVEEALITHRTPADFANAAIYYAQTDNLEKSASLIRKAIEEGYQNKNVILSDRTPLFNLAPIRHLLK